MQLPVTLENLPELDNGSAGKMVNAAIRDAITDLEDRGGDGKPRKVNITLTMKVMDNGQIAMHLEAIASLPKRRTAGTTGNPKMKEGRAQVLFQAYAPEEPEQRTIDEKGAMPGRGE